MPADVEHQTGDRHTHREMVTIKQACVLAQVSRRTINNWMIKRQIEWVHTAGRGVRIFRDTLFKKDPEPTPESPP